MSTIAFAYLLHLESIPEAIVVEQENNLDGISILILNIINKILWNEKSLVSAQTLGIFKTCPKTKDGRYCIEYLSAECAANCAEDCIDALASEIDNCRIGSCYDGNEGTCAANSIKKQCEDSGGSWLNDINANSPQCKKGCCIIGSEAMFITEGACSRIAEILGMQKTFNAEINAEATCLLSAQAEKDGACLVGKEQMSGKNLCVFTTRSSCTSLKGEFYEDNLCSHPDLNSVCEKQKESGCIEDRDEVYWFDSCGNRENIYDANKAKSWNNGKVLSKQESCSVGASGNIQNQGTCGNCNYFKGTTCGNKTAQQRLLDITQDYVCRDLSCIDENGKIREHGESWCEYFSAIGLNNEKTRSMDVPGSNHFRKVCFEGEIRTEPCADGRSEVCVESKTNIDGREFSTSSCRINRWLQCVDYNTKDDKAKAMRDCAASTDCFVKSVGVSSGFHFEMCAPKYPPGFDLVLNPEGAENACNVASQTCTVVYVKKITKGGFMKKFKKFVGGGTWDLKKIAKAYAVFVMGAASPALTAILAPALGPEWVCVENCQCESASFTNQMHDLCMSMGDCGASVNYLGKLTKNYRVSFAPELGDSYISEISRYNQPISGKVAEPGTLAEIYDYSSTLGEAYGAPGELNEILESKGLANVNSISGATGTLFFLLKEAIPGGAAAIGPSAGALAAVGNAVAGAAMGFALTYILLKSTGVSAGLPPSLTYSLLGLGAAAGAAIMAGSVIAAEVPIIGWVVAAVIVVFVGVAKLAGVGNVKERIVQFKCNPWQPPKGGDDCSKCGERFPCSTYSCQSLGVTCRFFNEGTRNEECAAISAGDIAPPMISPLQSRLGDSYEYSNVSNLGFRIKTKTGDGCIKLYTPLEFGISLDKIGKCRWDAVHGIKYEDMEFDFSTGLFKTNHSVFMNIPAPIDEDLPSYNPGVRAEYNMYVKCENGNGYAAEGDYVINFCVMPADDYSAPLIRKGAGDVYIPYGTTSKNLSIYTNEPAQCKWDTNINKSYETMAKSMECMNDLNDETVLGWECMYNFQISKDETPVYIRCEDKQWENDTTKRNVNSESTPMKIIRTPKLEIYSAEPNDKTIVSGVEPTSVEVVLQTTGGLNGEALCSYSLSGTYYSDFFETLGKTHRQVFESFTAGNKKIILRCEDLPGNIAEKTIKFAVEIDTKAPKITRIYSSGGGIFIRTDEPAQCALSKETCNFDFKNGTMMLGMGTEHTITPDKNVIYYVKCADPYGNTKGNCELKIKVL